MKTRVTSCLKDRLKSAAKSILKALLPGILKKQIEVTRKAPIDAATGSSEFVRHVIEGSDHGLGVFSNEPTFTDEAVMTTVEFLDDRL